MAARKKAVKKQITSNAVDRLVEDMISGLVWSKSQIKVTGNYDNKKITVKMTLMLEIY